ncbi:SseB family protein [Kitasatospora sp. NPDC056138]|uniref:SseB family protein n=1 Tax=Kitasatospora sp. NPDC056138 TaxID=3345724 RepID=UPI0035D8F02C
MGDPWLLVGEFRSSVLLVPRTSEGLLWTGDEGGLRWIFAFSSEAELTAFARARQFGGDRLDYLTVYGSRLLDVAVPALGVPGGVAVDVAGKQPMLFPPMRGIVPDAVALDAGAGAGAGAPNGSRG